MRTLYVDAGVLHNGGYGGTQKGRIAIWEDDRLLLDEPIGDRTNNEGELLAIKRALELALRTNEPVKILSDSMLAVNLVNRTWKTKKPHLQAILETIYIPPGSLVAWISRDINRAGNYLEEVHAL